MTLTTMSPEQLEGADKTLRRGTWTITAGAVMFSVLTVTPLVQRVTPDEWDWTAPILPIVVDVAVVIVVRLDSTVSRLGGSTGGWPAVLRWMTGLFTLLLNVGDSALKRDMVGVLVHAVAPLLLIVTAEAGLAYRRKIADALERIAREQAAEQERSRAAEQARREQEKAERLEAEERSRQEQERAREHAERLERERLEREAEQRREEREHALELERQRADLEAQQRREEREERERVRLEEQRRADREHAERLEREQRERAERERLAAARAARREQPAAAPVNTGADSVNTTAPALNIAPEKLLEDDARRVVAHGFQTSASVREIAEETGWSVGWVSARLRELREQQAGQPALATAGAA